MGLTPNGIRADTASCGAGVAADGRRLGLGDAVVRHRLREALERELAVATAAADQAVRERLLTALQSAITA